MFSGIKGGLKLKATCLEWFSATAKLSHTNQIPVDQF